MDKEIFPEGFSTTVVPVSNSDINRRFLESILGNGTDVSTSSRENLSGQTTGGSEPSNERFLNRLTGGADPGNQKESSEEAIPSSSSSRDQVENFQLVRREPMWDISKADYLIEPLVSSTDRTDEQMIFHRSDICRTAECPYPRRTSSYYCSRRCKNGTHSRRGIDGEFNPPATSLPMDDIDDGLGSGGGVNRDVPKKFYDNMKINEYLNQGRSKPVFADPAMSLDDMILPDVTHLPSLRIGELPMVVEIDDEVCFFFFVSFFFHLVVV